MTLEKLRGLRAAATRRLAGERLLGAALLTLIAAPAFAIGVINHGAVERHVAQPLLQVLQAPRVETARPRHVVWLGRDIDGDGAADLVNPTGAAPRGADAYGSGAFGASRDGGQREHAGVDYVAVAGQAVRAPISGFVTKIGFPYAGDSGLFYVEIDNPALKIAARVFYVEPAVQVGQLVRLGAPIGHAQTLQARYPGGITDHVHLEMIDPGGRRMDATRLITAQLR
ncbi:M23 family metallopeptidase [Phenylobacterium immobile]|uniref:M23 family metallopeptidase n=1 Tax=Phenylobacterium immobile TaxID=21 RepID=UPI000B09100E|nr:M23 family metallopeptidase [Phenylobacterium immobile]